MAINRNGRFDYKGIPTCHYHQIQPASTNEAIETCPDSVIGKGTFAAHVVLPEQSPFPSQGKVVAFNGIFHGRHVVYAHVYGTVPLPQSNVLVFELGKVSGTYRTTLTAQLPQVAAEWGYVSAVSLALKRTVSYKGEPKSLISAGLSCSLGVPGGDVRFRQGQLRVRRRADLGGDDDSELLGQGEGGVRS